MKDNHFTYRELLVSGWEKTKEHFWFLLTAMALYAVIGAVTFPIPLIGTISSMLLTIAVITITLVIVHGAKPNYDDFTKSLKSFDTIWHYVVATILYSIAVLLGLIVFILPGIFIAVRLQFYSYSIVEHEHLDPVEALKKSWHITSGKFWKLLGFFFISIFLIIVSAIPLGLGLIFSIPAISIAYGYLYKKLAHEPVRLAEAV